MGGNGEGPSSQFAADYGNRSNFGLPTGNDQGEQLDGLAVQLWHACAGPQAYVPRLGDMVVYFPQGHLEQIQEYVNQDSMKSEVPVYNLPPKVPCRVVHIDYRAESTTDEVYAQITLLPEPKDESSDDENSCQKKIRSTSFTKKLTPSDTSTHGGFSVPKKHADDCLPPLDMSQEPPSQELVAKDLHGFEWHFRHIYRGQPKRHLFTTGWSTFVTSKKLVPGDTFIFLRGENGQLLVGVRRMKLPKIPVVNIISGQCMQHGILTSAFHAISSGTMFTVYYRPWTCPEFLVPYEEYSRSIEIDYSPRTTFRMPFEDEECVQQRVTGTIIAAEDIDHIRWPDSDWRCLKVKWDNDSDANVHPERVNPWKIEPLEAPKRKPAAILGGQKRFRGYDASTSSSRFNRRTRDFGFASPNRLGVFQGQESSNSTGVNQPGALVPPIFIDLSLAWTQAQTGRLMNPIRDPFYQASPSNATLIPGGGNNMAGFGLPSHSWSSTVSSHGVSSNAAASAEFPVPTLNYRRIAEDWGALGPRDENGAPVADPNGGDRYMLFGVNIANYAPFLELPSPQVVDPSQLDGLCPVPPSAQSSVYGNIQGSEPFKRRSGIHSVTVCQNCCSVTNQTSTKVLKFGTALGRSVSLTRFNSYEDLVCELDKMFDFKGTLIDGTSGWHVTYIDDEGDMLLIGDCPWQELRFVARRMVLYPKEEIETMKKSSSQVPTSQL